MVNDFDIDQNNKIIDEDPAEYWNGSRETLKCTIADSEYVKENALDKLRDICVVDEYSKVIVHFENLKGKSMSFEKVATIKVFH
jgi:hypothetical protein